MDEARERAIVRGLREGRAEAWHALYDAHAEPVWRAVARLLGGNSADVADVVQETFLAAARSARTYDPARGSLWQWLWGIARTQTALHWRKHAQRERLRVGFATRGPERDGPASPVETLAAAELAVQVRGTLLELPEEYAGVLAAKYLDGASVEEIARDERSTTTAVRSRLARARQAFREAFGRRERESADGA